MRLHATVIGRFLDNRSAMITTSESKVVHEVRARDEAVFAALVPGRTLLLEMEGDEVIHVSHGPVPRPEG